MSCRSHLEIPLRIAPERGCQSNEILIEFKGVNAVGAMWAPTRFPQTQKRKMERKEAQVVQCWELAERAVLRIESLGHRRERSRLRARSVSLSSGLYISVSVQSFLV